MQEGEQSSQVSSSVQLVQEGNSQLALVASDPRGSPILLKIATFHILITHTIYTLIIYRNDKEPIERKTLRKVSTTHPPYQRELLILREKSLQSLLLHSPIVIPIERRFIPKHYPHPFKVLKVFLELGKHWKIPRMADAIWSLLRDLESQRRHNQA